MKIKPLTLQELREMAGRPVYCPDADGYGIVKCETKGHWAGIPFLVGAWHEDGVAVDFEYDIKKEEAEMLSHRASSRIGEEHPKAADQSRNGIWRYGSGLPKL